MTMVFRAAGCLAIALACLALCSASTDAANPSDIWVYEMVGAPADQRIAMSTLMGNVNRTNPEMYMAFQNSPAVSNPKIWLDRYVATQPATQVNWSSNAQFFVDKYKSQLDGYVLYDNAGTKVNEATSLAGVLNAIALTPVTEGLAISAGLTKLEDVTSPAKDTAWLVSNYGSQFNKDKLFALDNGTTGGIAHGHELRDYAVQHKGLMYWNPPAATKNAILAGQNDHSQVYGWDTSEFEFFEKASQNNLKAVAANFSQGYSALSQWDVNIPSQSTHTSPSTSTDDGKHYVAFVMSDGDNAQWFTNGFADDPKWFGSPHRGNFTMNWDMSPEFTELMPVVAKHLYESASAGATKDFFVTAHGPGTDYPSQVPDYTGSLAATTAAMHAADHNVLSILDNLSGGTWDTSKLDIMLNDSTVLGGMYKTNNSGAYNGLGGQIYWHNGKPMMSVKHSLWDGFGTAASISNALNTAPTSPLLDQGSYSIVNIHPWSTGGLGDAMSNLNDLVDQLDADVEVVTMEKLMIHLRRNFGTPVTSGPSDFNADGFVDNADLTIWEASYGITSGAGQSQGDADDDGDVDGHDFLDWQRAFTGGPPTTPPTNLVTNGNFESGSVGWVTGSNGFEALYPDDASTGVQSAGFDTTVLADIGDPSTWADWRSVSFAVTPGETLQWEFSYKIGTGSDGEILAELRGFTDATLTTFIAEDTAVLSDTGDLWETVSQEFIVPAGVTAVDLRFNNIFTNVLDPFLGSFRLDDVAVYVSASPLGVGTAAVPEPNSIFLVFIGLVVGLTSERRDR
jgi:hypothetical protein